MKQLIKFLIQIVVIFTLVSGYSAAGSPQQAGHVHDHSQTVVPLQPLAQQVRQIEAALRYLGQPLQPADQRQINDAIARTDEKAAVSELESVLDKHALVIVEINPESRVKVKQGAAKPELVEGGARLFLVKIINQAGVTAPLAVQSPNSGPVYIKSKGDSEPPSELTFSDVTERWADISVYNKSPMRERLSGLGLEYQILQVSSRDRGQRSAQMSFSVGQGSQDIGYRNDVTILFNALPARSVKLRVRDENGSPTVASFTIRDQLSRVYPAPSKRLAPDFPFQPQVYRADGSTIHLPDGKYIVTCTRGPEYLPESKEFVVENEQPVDLSFQLKRWIDPSKYGWFSGDHHIHAAGCSHYQNPTQGVLPQDMWNQIQGEALNIGCVLTWGPCYYYQKQFFSGQDHPLSKPNQLIHYDLEVSGFPSSHAGHLVFLGLKEQDYPGAKRIEEWPTWDLPLLKWARSQGAVVGFAHSGWGLEVKGNELPNYQVPGFDGIGANEYIVDVTHPGSVDFISTADTPYSWELNIWYHTLNVGFRTRVSGETDFPCIFDSRVGQGRAYAKAAAPVTYSGWLESIRAGRSYVSDGRSHLMDFKVNGVDAGTNESEIRLDNPGTAHAELKVAAYLDPVPDPEIQKLAPDRKPYWDIERARIGKTREVSVELVVNGKSIAQKNIVADGKLQNVQFDFPLEQSSWVAVRILGSSHTNPVFAILAGKPIRASRRSAEWCLAGVNQCWTQKAPKISAKELQAARKAYDHARQVYSKLIAECANP
ncbi:MAG TPA: CehA/McbA family metallohydrolase [Acidobacteriota bacterium]|jgi:hypothetical protein|nr:CehA/McbA family metallohydrolase [Acidobacteriota bacterium]